MVLDNYKLKKLKELGINIKSTYISDGKLLERNTDDSKNENVIDGVLFEKEYFKDGKSIHKETDFDTRIEYSYYTDIDDKKNYTCSNCGYTGKVKEFKNGCPYCKTSYNIDYKDKELGNKYHYDSVLKSNTYKVVTLIIDVIVSMFLSYLLISTTSRTFNSYDILKVVLIGTGLSLVLYYVFYVADAYVVLKPIKKYKDKMNKKQQEFWERTKYDKKTFYNNVLFELDNYFYKEGYIIDYDIIDYLKFEEFNEANTQYVEIEVSIKVITYINNKIKTKVVKETFCFKKKDRTVIELKNGINLIKCSKCGSSINVLDGKCSYCGTEIGSLGEWEYVRNKY